MTSPNASSRPGLSKSRYLAGLQCEKRLWQQAHARQLATPPDASLQAVFDTGNEVGLQAHELFPGGVLVEEGYRQQRQAEERTARLMADASVPAIFEAAFTYEGVRIRVDVLERLPADRWGLREVKSTTSAKPVHHPDVAVQLFVLEGCGLEVTSVELIHIDSSYVRGESDIDWPRFFARADLTLEARDLLPEIRVRVPKFHEMLARAESPDIAPWRHCNDPYGCEFQAHCQRDLPDDWILNLPWLGETRAAEFRARGIERIRDIPEGEDLNPTQRRVRAAVTRGESYLSDDLAEELEAAALPALYLDFETVASAIPFWPGTRPYQAIPFQWSLHQQEPGGALEHREFLAEADAASDPRPAFATSLLTELEARPGLPILVYSSYESRMLRELAVALPKFANRLEAIRGRLVDLLPIMRRNVYHPHFHGSFSIKAVAPALAPDFGYDDLEAVADGDAAQQAFAGLIRGDGDAAKAGPIREALLAYCERDTLAMVELHRALVDLAPGGET